MARNGAYLLMKPRESITIFEMTNWQKVKGHEEDQMLFKNVERMIWYTFCVVWVNL